MKMTMHMSIDESIRKVPDANATGASTSLISIIVPALNEAENLPLLLPRIDQALAGRAYEVIVVDDNSRDGTPGVCAELAKSFPLKLAVREHPTNGLSGAVLHGFSLARGDVLVTMDADLQHPPERLPDVIAPLERNEADFVIGSRYVAGGTTEDQWGLFRKINSNVATLLARPFAGKTRDPMSGFFGLTRATFERATRLTPLGYKIGLELMCKCRVQRVREVPIHFAVRAKGESKLTLKQQFKYLEHLSRLYDYTFPRASPLIKFTIATVLGWAVALGVFTFVMQFSPNALLAPILAYPASIFVTAVFHLRYVRTQRDFLARPRPWMDFWIISLAEWAICILTALYLTWRVPHLRALELFFFSFGAGTLTRYVLRKEFLLDVRGLRREIRREEHT